MSRWTDGLRERVKFLWPNHSATEICGRIWVENHIQFSRNSVVGLLHRMKLTADVKTKIHPQTRTRTVRAPIKRISRTAKVIQLHVVNRTSHGSSGFRSKIITVKVPELRCVEIIPRNLTLVELEDNDCRYIAGEDFLFCAHPKKTGSSFCPAHHDICFEAPRPRTDKWGAAA